MEEHPRIAQLRVKILGLPVSEPARKVLLQSIEHFRGHLRLNNSQRGGPLTIPNLRQALTSGITDRVTQEHYR